MSQYKVILLDLDGTLSDPKEGITKSVQYALQKLNIVEPDLVIGSHLDGTRSAKVEIIQYIINTFSQYSLDEFIMIGDRKHDVIGAKQTGIDSIGVTYGYGSKEELREYNPIYVL
ncbi:HAD hydrolase-like protein [Bacillus coreaensis]